MSFDLFAYKELLDTVADCEDRCDELERRIQFPNMKSWAEKNSQENLLTIWKDLPYSSKMS